MGSPILAGVVRVGSMRVLGDEVSTNLAVGAGDNRNFMARQLCTYIHCAKQS